VQLRPAGMAPHRLESLGLIREALGSRHRKWQTRQTRRAWRRGRWGVFAETETETETETESNSDSNNWHYLFGDHKAIRCHTGFHRTRNGGSSGHSEDVECPPR
jgi:hypothetical protein